MTSSMVHSFGGPSGIFAADSCGDGLSVVVFGVAVDRSWALDIVVVTVLAAIVVVLLDTRSS